MSEEFTRFADNSKVPSKMSESSVSTESTQLIIYQLSAGQHYHLTVELARDFEPNNPALEGVKISAGMMVEEVASAALDKVNAAIPIPNPIDLYDAYYEARDATMAAIWESMVQAQAVTMPASKFQFEPANILIYTNVYGRPTVDLVLIDVNGRIPTARAVAINPTWRDHLQLVIMRTQNTFPTD